MSDVLDALAKLAAHPISFGVGVGVANGLLAEGRSLPLTLKSAGLSAVVIGVTEALIAAEVPKRDHSLYEIAGYSVLGIAIGLAPFISLHSEEKSLVQTLMQRPALEHA